MRGGQALPNVHSKQGILAQGDVKLEELWQAEVKQGPPKHPWRNFLAHAPPDLQAARVYAAVAACPRTWSKGERNCIICDCGLRSSRVNRQSLQFRENNVLQKNTKSNPMAFIGTAQHRRLRAAAVYVETNVVNTRLWDAKRCLCRPSLQDCRLCCRG